MDAESVTIVISIQESNLLMNASAKLWCVVLVSVSTPPRLMSGCYNVDSKYGIALQTANTGQDDLQKVKSYLDIQNNNVMLIVLVCLKQV